MIASREVSALNFERPNLRLVPSEIPQPIKELKLAYDALYTTLKFYPAQRPSILKLYEILSATKNLAIRINTISPTTEKLIAYPLPENFPETGTTTPSWGPRVSRQEHKLLMSIIKLQNRKHLFDSPHFAQRVTDELPALRVENTALAQNVAALLDSLLAKKAA